MPWPKVNEGKTILADILDQYNGDDEDAMVEALFGLLRYDST